MPITGQKAFGLLSDIFIENAHKGSKGFWSFKWYFFAQLGLIITIVTTYVVQILSYYILSY